LPKLGLLQQLGGSRNVREQRTIERTPANIMAIARHDYDEVYEYDDIINS